MGQLQELPLVWQYARPEEQYLHPHIPAGCPAHWPPATIFFISALVKDPLNCFASNLFIWRNLIDGLVLISGTSHFTYNDSIPCQYGF
jgi:hypothetical protein